MWAIGGSIAAMMTAGFLWKRFFGRGKKRVGVVSKLVIYPLKSCKGIPVPEAECTPHGLAYGSLRDRCEILSGQVQFIYI